MTMLFDIDDFEETRTEWVPVMVRWDQPQLVRLVSADVRCRDCGKKAGYNQGGANQVGTYMVCDECAQIDGCRIREHEAVIYRGRDRWLPNVPRIAQCLHCAWFLSEHTWDEHGRQRALTVADVEQQMLDHVRPRHTSHWGMSHEIADHDRLVAAQAKRRAAFLAGTSAHEEEVA